MSTTLNAPAECNNLDVVLRYVGNATHSAVDAIGNYTQPH